MYLSCGNFRVAKQNCVWVVFSYIKENNNKKNPNPKQVFCMVVCGGWTEVSQLLVMVVSSSYFTTEFSWCLGVQSWVYSVNRRGLSTQPWGALVQSTNVEDCHECGVGCRKCSGSICSLKIKLFYKYKLFLSLGKCLIFTSGDCINA